MNSEPLSESMPRIGKGITAVMSSRAAMTHLTGLVGHAAVLGPARGEGVSHCLCKGLGLNGGGRLAITGQENFVVTI